MLLRAPDAARISATRKWLRLRLGQSSFVAMVLLLSLKSAAHASPSPLPERVSIGLATAKTSLTLNLPAGTAASGPAGMLWRAEADSIISLTSRADGHLAAGELDFGPGPVRFAGPGLLGWNGRVYRGEFIVVRRPEGLTLINEVGLEDYLRGVVPAEVDPAWPMEALKAQAVAARTFTLARLGYHRREGFDLCASVDCQVYLGAGVEHPNTDLAVAETAGQVITFQGRRILAYFHAASGGHTEDVEAVWPTSTPFAYLRGVPDPAEVSPYNDWRVELDWSAVQAAVAARYPAVGRLLGLEVVRRTPAGRVLELALVGDRGKVRINGAAARHLFALRSALFFVEIERSPAPVIRPEEIARLPVHPTPAPMAIAFWERILSAGDWDLLPTRLRITGRGSGHGVGLSQWGAKGLAEQGYTYVSILKHYYQGTEVEDWRPPQVLPPAPGDGEGGGS